VIESGTEKPPRFADPLGAAAWRRVSRGLKADRITRHMVAVGCGAYVVHVRLREAAALKPDLLEDAEAARRLCRSIAVQFLGLPADREHSPPLDQEGRDVELDRIFAGLN
jgi:hypothetical protein